MEGKVQPLMLLMLLQQVHLTLLQQMRAPM
jgi:hypothetical protein